MKINESKKKETYKIYFLKYPFNGVDAKGIYFNSFIVIR